MSAQVCATALPNGTIRWLASVRPGDDFEADCIAAGGDPSDPRRRCSGTVPIPAPEASGIPLTGDGT
jgi:hypothetical protein